MSDVATESACWRVWYYLNERGATWESSIKASANVDESLFDAAIDTLQELDVVMETEHSDARDESKYVCTDSDPPFFAVFPRVMP
jgi:hypothetical protein